MYLDVKQSTAIDVFVFMRAVVDGSPLTGVLLANVSVWVQVQGGSSAQKVLMAGDWVEVDSTNQPGVYKLHWSAADLGTLGPMAFTIQYPGVAVPYPGVLNVVLVLGADIYSRIGAPTGASISADIANAIASIKGASNKDLTQVDTDVTANTTAISNLSTKVGTPAGASVSADIAAVKSELDSVKAKTDALPADPASQAAIKGVNNKDLSQVDADVNTVITNLAAAVTSIKGVSNKDLTQVDTDVNTVITNLATLTAIAQRILALSYDNVVEDGQTYDTNGKLLSSNIWFYDTAAHATTNDHVTGLTYKYAITGTYTGGGNCTLFRMTRVL